MPPLPTRFVAIIVAFSGLFRQRTWRYAEPLLIGAMLAPGIRAVAGVLRVLGLADERHFVSNTAAFPSPRRMQHEPDAGGIWLVLRSLREAASRPCSHHGIRQHRPEMRRASTKHAEMPHRMPEPNPVVVHIERDATGVQQSTGED